MSVPGWSYRYSEVGDRELTVAELILELLRYDGDMEVVMVGEEPVTPGTTINHSLDDTKATTYKPTLIWCNTTQLIIRGRKIK